MRLNKLTLALVAVALAACTASPQVQLGKPIDIEQVKVPSQLDWLPKQFLTGCDVPNPKLLTYGDLAIAYATVRRALLLCDLKHQNLTNAVKQYRDEQTKRTVSDD